MNSKYSVNIVSTIQEIEPLREAWKQMQRHPNVDIDFYLTVIKTRPEIIRPYLIVISNNGNIEVILIGRIENIYLESKIGYFKVLKAPVQSLTFVYGGLLGKLNDQTAKILFTTIQSSLSRNEVDVVYFPQMKLGSDLHRMINTHTNFFMRSHLPITNVHRTLTIPDSYEGYLNTLSKKKRKNLRAYSNRLNRDYGEQVQSKCYNSLNDIENILNHAETVASKSYKRGMGVGFINNEERRNLTRVELSKGWLYAYVLYINQQPAAYCYVLKFGNMLYANGRDYDPKYKDYRLGHFLQDKVIQDFCPDKTIAAMDFGFGDSEYKREICDQSWQEASIYLFSPTLKGIALNLLRLLLSIVNLLLEFLVKRFRFYQKIKKKWRGNLAKKQTTKLIYSS